MLKLQYYVPGASTSTHVFLTFCRFTITNTTEVVFLIMRARIQKSTHKKTDPTHFPFFEPHAHAEYFSRNRYPRVVAHGG